MESTENCARHVVSHPKVTDSVMRMTTMVMLGKVGLSYRFPPWDTAGKMGGSGLCSYGLLHTTDRGVPLYSHIGLHTGDDSAAQMFWAIAAQVGGNRIQCL